MGVVGLKKKGKCDEGLLYWIAEAWLLQCFVKNVLDIEVTCDTYGWLKSQSSVTEALVTIGLFVCVILFFVAKLEITQLSINGRMAEQIMGYLYLYTAI